MTRPMPGPPDPMPHEDSARPHDSAAAPWNYCSGCAAENRLRLADPKRLTDAECAAHRWQAASTLGLALYAPAEVLGVDIPEDGNMFSWERPDSEPLNREHDTWDRFATHPHALEEA